MAQRKSLPTGAVSDESGQTAAIQEVPATAAMSDYGFNSLVRSVHRAGIDRVVQLRQIVDIHKKRLGVRRGGRARPVTKTPDGSDQLDVQSINVWASRITVKDKLALNQLRVLDATLAYRLGD